MKLILILFLLFNLETQSEESNLKKSINFNHKGENGEALSKEDFMGYHELKRWASSQNIYLQPDSPLGAIKDGICRMIPETGLKFYLEAPIETKKKIYLYLDLTTYENLNKSKVPPRSIKVYISGKLKKIIYFKEDHQEENPAIISLEPSDLQSGRINIFLDPSSTSGGRFWGIWDAFYTFTKD
jgi:hypothetical protein